MNERRREELEAQGHIRSLNRRLLLVVVLLVTGLVGMGVLIAKVDSQINSTVSVIEKQCELQRSHYVQYRVRGIFDQVAGRVIVATLRNAIHSPGIPRGIVRFYGQEIAHVESILNRIRILPLPDCAAQAAELHN